MPNYSVTIVSLTVLLFRFSLGAGGGQDGVPDWYRDLPDVKGGGRATPICDPGMYKVPLDRVPQGPIDGVPQDAWKIGGDECHVHMFDTPQLFECMGDNWLVIFGGSNAVGTAGAALGLFTPEIPYSVERDIWLGCPGCSDSAGFVGMWDAIISADGKTVEHVKSSPADAIIQPMLIQDKSELDPTWWPVLRDMLVSAPIPSHGAVRITWIYSRWFPGVELVLREMRKTVPHMAAPSVHINIGVWYTYSPPASDADSNTVMRRNLKQMLDDFRQYQPEIKLIIRNQAYSDPTGLLPVWDEIALQPKPNNFVLLNWDFVSAEWNYIQEYPGVSFHPAHEGSDIILQQHFNLICPIPKVPIASSVIVFPAVPPCVHTPLEYYKGVTKQVSLPPQPARDPN